jgi:hypothetical protein
MNIVAGACKLQIGMGLDLVVNAACGFFCVIFPINMMFTNLLAAFMESQYPIRYRCLF